MSELESTLGDLIEQQARSIEHLEYWSSCRELDDTIRHSGTATDIKKANYLKKEVFEKVEKIYMNSLAILYSLEETVKDTAQPSGGETADCAPVIIDSRLPHSPDILFLKFSGEYAEWEGFRDPSESMIDKDPRMHNIWKFY